MGFYVLLLQSDRKLDWRTTLSLDLFVLTQTLGWDWDSPVLTLHLVSLDLVLVFGLTCLTSALKTWLSWFVCLKKTCVRTSWSWLETRRSDLGLYLVLVGLDFQFALGLICLFIFWTLDLLVLTWNLKWVLILDLLVLMWSLSLDFSVLMRWSQLKLVLHCFKRLSKTWNLPVTTFCHSTWSCVFFK